MQSRKVADVRDRAFSVINSYKWDSELSIDDNIKRIQRSLLATPKNSGLTYTGGIYYGASWDLVATAAALLTDGASVVTPGAAKLLRSTGPSMSLEATTNGVAFQGGVLKYSIGLVDAEYGVSINIHPNFGLGFYSEVSPSVSAGPLEGSLHLGVQADDSSVSFVVQADFGTNILQGVLGFQFQYTDVGVVYQNFARTKLQSRLSQNGLTLTPVIDQAAAKSFAGFLQRTNLSFLGNTGLDSVAKQYASLYADLTKAISVPSGNFTAPGDVQVSYTKTGNEIVLRYVKNSQIGVNTTETIVDEYLFSSSGGYYSYQDRKGYNAKIGPYGSTEDTLVDVTYYGENGKPIKTIHGDKGINLAVEQQAIWRNGFNDHCFDGDTAIALWSGASKPIRDIQIGDEVVSFEGQYDSVRGVVTDIHRNRAPRLLRLADGVLVTPEHPFFCEDGTFTPLEIAINDGKRLIDQAGDPRLVPTWSEVALDDPAVEVEDGQFVVYNFTVAKTHTYIANGWRVHNDSILFLVPEQYRGNVIAEYKEGRTEIATYQTEFGAGRVSSIDTDGDHIADVGFREERDADGSLRRTKMTQFEGGLADSATLNLGPSKISLVGEQLGSSIGNYLAKGNSLLGIGYSSMLGEIGERLGDVVRTSAAGYDLTASIDWATADGLASFGTQVAERAAGSAIGTVSSLLSMELGEALGLKGFGAELFTSVAGSTLQPYVSDVLATVMKNVGVPGANLLNGFNASFSGGIGQVLQSSITAYFATKLGSLIVQPQTAAGVVLGSLGTAMGAWAVAGTIGSFGAAASGAALTAAAATLAATSTAGVLGATSAAAVAASATATAAGSAAASAATAAFWSNAILPGVGMLIGFALGTLIGNLFGRKKPKIPSASAETVLQVPYSRYELGAISVVNNGDRGLVTSMATGARDTLNAVLKTVGGVYVSNLASPTQTYGHTSGQLWVQLGGSKINVASPDEAVEKGVLYALPLTKIVGGDIFLKRALSHSHATNLASLSGELQTASDYASYLANRVFINNKIATPAVSALSQDELNILDEAKGFAIKIWLAGAGPGASAAIVQALISLGAITQADYDQYVAFASRGVLDGVIFPRMTVAVQAYLKDDDLAAFNAHKGVLGFAALKNLSATNDATYLASTLNAAVSAGVIAAGERDWYLANKDLADLVITDGFDWGRTNWLSAGENDAYDAHYSFLLWAWKDGLNGVASQTDRNGLVNAALAAGKISSADAGWYQANIGTAHWYLGRMATSQFAAGWIVTLERIHELGLDKWTPSDFYGGLRGFLDSFDLKSHGVAYEDIYFRDNGNWQVKIGASGLVKVTDPESAAAQVWRLYDAILRRAPDRAGFDAHTAMLRNGSSLRDIATIFYNSAEFALSGANSLSNAQFVDWMYTNILRRPADAGNGWLALLNGGMSRVDALVGFSEAAEHKLITNAALLANAWIDEKGLDAFSILPTASKDGQSLTIDNFPSTMGYGGGYRFSNGTGAQGTSASDIIWSANDGAMALDDQHSETQWVENWVYDSWAGEYRDEGGYQSVTVDGGDDIFVGGQYNDVMLGRSGWDWLDGGAGDDALDGGSENDVLIGGAGNDMLWGGAGDDYLAGGDGADGLLGGAGNDMLVDGQGSEVLMGEDGDDTFLIAADYTFNWFWGGTQDPNSDANGKDTISAERLTFGVTFNLDYRPPDWVASSPDPVVSNPNSRSAIVLNLETQEWIASDGLLGIENATGSNFNDALYGTAGDNVLKGLSGDDQLSGQAGNDIIEGGAGADMMDGSGDYDILSYAGSATGVFIDMTTGEAFGGDADGDFFSGFEGVRGSQLADQLKGNAGDNRLEGLGGDDWLVATAGADIFDGGEGKDFVDYSEMAAGVTLYLGGYTPTGVTNGYGYGAPYNTPATGQVYIGVEGVVGTAFGDSLGAGDGDQTFVGGAGNDWLAGGAGADTYVLNRGDGYDTVTEDNQGWNTFSFGENVKFSDLWIGASGGSNGWLDVGIRGTSDVIRMVSNFGAYPIAGNNKLKSIDLNGAGQLDVGAMSFAMAGDDNANLSLYGAANRADLIFGYNGDDKIYGVQSGLSDQTGDVFVGGLGNDSLYGSGGDDQYAYDRGDGVDTITDVGGEDTLVFGSTVAADDVIYEVVGNHLYIGAKNPLDPSQTAYYAPDHVQIWNGGIKYVVKDGYTDQVLYESLNTVEYVIAGGTSIDLRKLDIQWTEQVSYNYDNYYPIALDLDGDGLNLSSVEGSSVVVKTAQGGLSKIGWVGPTDGFLAVDRDGDGAINKLSEISFVQDKPGATSDLEGLRTWDTNGDGVLDKADKDFSKILLFVDANQNGRSTAKELRTLEAAGIVAINLGGEATGYTRQMTTESFVQNTISFVWADGRTGQGYDEVKAAAQVDFSDNDRVDATIAKRWKKLDASQQAAWLSGQASGMDGYQNLASLRSLSAEQSQWAAQQQGIQAGQDLVSSGLDQASAGLSSTGPQSASSDGQAAAAGLGVDFTTVGGLGGAASGEPLDGVVVANAAIGQDQAWWRGETGEGVAGAGSLGALLAAMEQGGRQAEAGSGSSADDPGLLRQQALLRQAMAGFGGETGGSAAVWNRDAGQASTLLAAAGRTALPAATNLALAS